MKSQDSMDVMLSICAGLRDAAGSREEIYYYFILFVFQAGVMCGARRPWTAYVVWTLL